MNILFDEHVEIPKNDSITLCRITDHGDSGMLLSVARDSKGSSVTFSMNLTSFDEIAMLERALEKAKQNFTKVD